MAFVESTNYALIAKTIASEIANAGLASAIPNAPTAGALEMAGKAGDLFVLDTKQPRIVVWYHPLSKTEAAIIHCWGPSALWNDIMLANANFLISKGFTTARWVTGNPLATQGKTVTTASNQPDGTVTVNIATGRTKLIAAGAKALP